MVKYYAIQNCKQVKMTKLDQEVGNRTAALIYRSFVDVTWDQ